jgi:hypothetical protein
MPITYKASGGGGNFTSVPAGSHIAVCNLVADLGLQPGSVNFPQAKRQVYIRFEVPAERVEYERDGKKREGPVVIGSTYTASMHEKSNLRKQLEGWRGKKFNDEEAERFDVASILGKACMLSIVENVKGDKVYSNIAGIGSLPRGIPAPKAENELLYYAEDDKSQLSKLPEWLQKKIAAQIVEDYSPVQQKGYGDGTEITDEDIPF